MLEQLRSTEVSEPAVESDTTSRVTCRVSRGAEVSSVWVELAGELNSVTASGLESDLRGVEAGARLLVFDLREVTVIDSGGLETILDASLRGGSVTRQAIAIVKPRSPVQRLLTLTGLDQRLDVLDDPAAAAAAEALLAWAPPGAPLSRPTSAQGFFARSA